MQRVAYLVVGLVLCTSHGRRLQTEQKHYSTAGQIEASDASEALALLLQAASSKVAFNGNFPGASQITSRPASLERRNCAGRHMIMQLDFMDKEPGVEELDEDDGENYGEVIIVNEDEDPDEKNYLLNELATRPIQNQIDYMKGAAGFKTRLAKWKMKDGYFQAGGADTDLVEPEEYATLEAALEADDEPSFEEGAVLQGTVTGFAEEGEEGVLVDLGGKCGGFLLEPEAADIFEVGQSVTVKVVGERDEVPLLMMAMGTGGAPGLAKLKDVMEKDLTVNATVTFLGPQGYNCDVLGVAGSIPISHMIGEPDEALVGKTIPVKIIDVSEEGVSCSHRRGVSDSAFLTLEVGSVVQGKVASVKPYGIFVDLGGLSGLLHVSQISMDHTERVEEILPVGMTIKAMVINQDKARGRVALSTKTLEPEPGDMLRNPDLVFEKAEETALKYQERMEVERKAREEAAQDVLFGLEALTEGLGLDPKDLDLGSLGLGSPSPPPEAPEA